MNTNEYEKELMKIDSFMNRVFGIRMLIAYQCIKCGMVFDNPDMIITHWMACRNKKPEGEL